MPPPPFTKEIKSVYDNRLEQSTKTQMHGWEHNA